MQRSLFAGVSGLTNHQVILDVTANNLANVSTPGYKGSRVSFATAMQQTQSAGLAPSEQSGGVNPRQIGLGVTSNSIDVDMRQGALVSTGRTLDVAIQGAGFFKVTRTNPLDGTYYTRVGNFGFDENDNLVDLGSGLLVHGLQNNTQGPISLSQYRAINASATSVVNFQGNLDANSRALRGKDLKAVMPIVNRNSNEPATEDVLLKDLTIFRGDGADAGLMLSGTGTIPAAPTTPIELKAPTVLTTGGRIRTQVTVPAANYSGANAMALTIRREGVVIGSVVVNQNLTGASATARTFTIESNVKVNANDTITIVASDDTNLNAPPPAAATGNYTYTTSVLTELSVFGTRSDGEAYGGKISVDPWKETLGDLVNKINAVLTHGTQTFGIVTVENGNLTARALEPGDGFSLFIGEDDRLPLSAPEPQSQGIPALSGPGAAHPGSGNTVLIAPTPVGAAGALRPTFTMPNLDLSSQLGASLIITVKINGNSAGNITVPAADYTSVSPVFTLATFPLVKPSDVITYEVTGSLNTGGQPISVSSVLGRLSEDGTGPTGYAYRGNAVSNVAAVTMPYGGLLRPSFTMPAVDLSSQVGRSLKISIKINGAERGSIAIPPADYTGGANRTFTMPNLPHVKTGDVVSYDLTGNLDLGAGNELTWSTSLVRDSDTLSILQDRDANGNPNGMVDMFEDHPTDPITTDINRWQYAATNNTNFDWYRVRFSPETVISTIDVFDTNGTKHSFEARFFKTGSVVDNSGARINVWDMMANINPAEGRLLGDLVTGLRFDQYGRYVGDATLGTTARGSGLDANGYRGQPDNNRIEIQWNASGNTTIRMDFGATNGTNGLTGFGSKSTAAAIGQDGYANGSLESLAVEANGDLRGLYSNGQSQTIAILQVYTFRNPAGMLAAGTNLWMPSSNSGDATARTPGQAGAGTLTSGSLEGSNVDIASEFTRLITAQRGFQVSARIIQTTDQMLQELAGLIR